MWLTFSALAKFVAPKSSMEHPVCFCKSWCFIQASDQSNTREKEIDNPQVRVHEDMCLLQVHLPTLQFLNILCLILCGPKSVNCRHENIWNDKKERNTNQRDQVLGVLCYARACQTRQTLLFFWCCSLVNMDMLWLRAFCTKEKEITNSSSTKLSEWNSFSVNHSMPEHQHLQSCFLYVQHAMETMKHRLCIT